MSDLFAPTRVAGAERLQAFLPEAGQYGQARNFVRPGNPEVARLSPWLQKRLLLESEVVAAVRQQWSFAAVEKFVQEVYWRTYWKGWLEHRPGVWQRWKESLTPLRTALQGDALSSWQSACAGTTGIAGFDDWARELVATGYLHNHARMWFASIWIHTLRLPWELGAAFFFEHLLDGDAASNTLSWRWVAGLQTAGKTYLARADNIAHYTDGRYAPRPDQLATSPRVLTEAPVAKLIPWMEDPSAGKAAATLSGPVGLWIHPEDLAVELGELAAHKVAAIYAPWPKAMAQQAGWSEPVAKWTQNALRDSVQRASAHFQAPVAHQVTDDLAGDVAAWAKTHGIKHLIAYRPFVGPWQPIALALEQSLAACGIAITWRRRAWDTALFPHATRGYFPFWEHVKTL